MRRLRMHDSAFKAKVAFEAAKGEKKIAEIAAVYEVHPNHVSAVESGRKASFLAVLSRLS